MNAAASAPCRTTCRPASSGVPGGPSSSAPTASRTAGPGRSASCPSCATGSAPATSGCAAAGATATSRTFLLPRPTFAALRAEGPLPVGVAGGHRGPPRVAAGSAGGGHGRGRGARRGRPAARRHARRGRAAHHAAPGRGAARGEAARGRMPTPSCRGPRSPTCCWRWTAGPASPSASPTQRSGRPADDRAALLTAVLADGINLGLTRMAEACRGPTLRQLAWTHDWHVREECYAAALARLIEAHRALPLAAAWGDGSHLQLGRAVLPCRRPRRGARRRQRPARQRARRRVLHPRLRPVRPLPHQGHRGDRVRGAARAGRAAPARHRPAHRRALHRHRRRDRPGLRASSRCSASASRHACAT